MSSKNKNYIDLQLYSDACIQNCRTIDEVKSTVETLLDEGITTIDLEVERWAILNDLQMLQFVLTLGKVVDMKHILGSAIIAKSSIEVIIVLSKNLVINHLEDDIFYLCVKFRNPHAMLTILKYAKCDSDFMLTISSLTIEEMENQLFCWDMKNPKFKRNLFHAIFNDNFELAQQLIENGCDFDFWGNQIIKMLVEKYKLQGFIEARNVISLILKKGGRLDYTLKNIVIPKNTSEIEISIEKVPL